MWLENVSDIDLGLLLLFCAVVLIVIELKFYTHMVSGLMGTALLFIGTLLVLRGQVAPPLAIAISSAVGVIVLFLGNLGMKAAKAKRLSGLQTLVGETGVSRTDLNPDGTVFVNGEYWQARSIHNIAAGQRVRVERIDNMTVWVTEA